MEQFEYDEDKRALVLEERGVDLRVAARIFEHPDGVMIAEDKRRDYGEVRMNAVGTAPDGKAYCVVYTMRGDVCRLITAWRLNDKSRRKVEKDLARRDR